jgi:hypothetical protein
MSHGLVFHFNYQKREDGVLCVSYEYCLNSMEKLILVSEFHVLLVSPFVGSSYLSDFGFGR